VAYCEFAGGPFEMRHLRFKFCISSFSGDLKGLQNSEFLGGFKGSVGLNGKGLLHGLFGGTKALKFLSQMEVALVGSVEEGLSLFHLLFQTLVFSLERLIGAAKNLHLFFQLAAGFGLSRVLSIQFLEDCFLFSQVEGD
jgi:hypothetical protein